MKGPKEGHTLARWPPRGFILTNGNQWKGRQMRLTHIYVTCTLWTTASKYKLHLEMSDAWDPHSRLVHKFPWGQGVTQHKKQRDRKWNPTNQYRPWEAFLQAVAFGSTHEEGDAICFTGENYSSTAANEVHTPCNWQTSFRSQNTLIA